MGANDGPKTIKNELETPTTVFVLLAVPIKTDQLSKFFNFCVFLPISIKFGTETNIGHKMI